MPTAINRVLDVQNSRRFRDAAFVFLVVLVAALFGILTRPMGFLAAVWPANAILLGLMVRNPALARPVCCVAAVAAYLVADLVTGGALAVTIWLTIANMIGVLVGFVLFMQTHEEDRRLEGPLSIVGMFCICAIAAAATGVVGSGVALAFFDKDLFTGFAFWFTTELVNAIIVLPVILTAPPIETLLHRIKRIRLREHDWRPILLLIAATVGGIVVGGPGAFAYPMPALLWCALSYNFFTTAVVTMFFCVVKLVATSAGIIPAYAGDDSLLVTVSVRLAVALLALGPLAVASINAARDELLRKLQYVADHDVLTGVLSRGAFLSQAGQRFAASGGRRSPIAVLMLDIDHFKAVNDRFGHATGDHVLTETAHVLSQNLRECDILGRLGGEEFAIVCSTSSPDDTAIVAERLRKAVEQLTLTGPNGEPLKLSVSIGVATNQDQRDHCLNTLLARADTALYQAKAKGRNIVAVSDAAPIPLRTAQG